MLRNQYAATRMQQWESEVCPSDGSPMLCCCCWPPYYCSLALSVIDASVVGIFTFRAADLLYRSGNHWDWINVVILVILLGLLVCELLAMSTLALSQHQNNSRYVLPRLTLLMGQFAVTTLIAIVLILYFMGFSEKINNAVINAYQYWSGKKLSEVDRLNATHELFMYAIGIFIVVVVYAVYDVFELYITRKYQNSLDTPPEFIPVRHQEPPRPAGPKLSLDHPHFVQPPPPYNPQYH